MASTLTIDANMRHIQYIVSLFCLCLCIFSAQAQRLAGYEKNDKFYYEVIFELDSTLFKDVRYVNPLDSAITKKQLLGVQKIIIKNVTDKGIFNLRISESELTAFTSTGLSDVLRFQNPDHFTMKEKKFITKYLGKSTIWLHLVVFRCLRTILKPIEIRIKE